MANRLKNKKVNEQLTHVTMLVTFVDEIWQYFHNNVGGFASDFAYYELLEQTENAFRKGFQELKYKEIKDYVEYLEFTFGINYKALSKIRANSRKRVKELRKIML